MAGGASAKSKPRDRSPGQVRPKPGRQDAASAPAGSDSGSTACSSAAASTAASASNSSSSGEAASGKEHSWTRRLLGGGTHLTILAILVYCSFAVRMVWGILYPVFPDVDPVTKLPVRKFSNKIKEGDDLTARVWIGNATGSTPFRKTSEPFLEFDFQYSWEGFRPVSKTADLTVEASQLARAEAPMFLAEVLHKNSQRVIQANGGLVKRMEQPQVIPKWKLLTGEPCSEAPEPNFTSPAPSRPVDKHFIGRGIPAMQVRLVFDTMAYPTSHMPGPYFPQLLIDEFWLTDDQLIKLNDTGASSWRTDVTFELMGAPRWRFQEYMHRGLKAQEDFWGKDSEEMLQIRDLYANTPPLLLAATMAVSILHLIFEFLAFKSDVEFFQDCDPEILNTYVSIQSIIVGIFMQVVLLLYLWDESANLLVLVTNIGTILVDCWKVLRAMKVEWKRALGFLPWPSLVSKVQKEKVDNFDSVAMKWLGLLLSPGIVGYAIYSLVFDCHRSWYSYVLMASSSCVYSLGFVLMTPQIFINYKYKSVAYLPWKKFVFRAISTFIDDLFALIIRMPTMHRLSCFRDDIVFLIYLYQRQIYKVDTNRAFDEEGYAVPTMGAGTSSQDKEGLAAESKKTK